MIFDASVSASLMIAVTDAYDIYTSVENCGEGALTQKLVLMDARTQHL